MPSLARGLLFTGNSCLRNKFPIYPTLPWVCAKWQLDSLLGHTGGLDLYFLG